MFVSKRKLARRWLKWYLTENGRTVSQTVKVAARKQVDLREWHLIPALHDLNGKIYKRGGTTEWEL